MLRRAIKKNNERGQETSERGTGYDVTRVGPIVKTTIEVTWTHTVQQALSPHQPAAVKPQDS